jgi:glycerate dehydrogenase
MSSKPKASFLDFATLGPDVDTSGLERLVEIEYFDFSKPEDVPGRVQGREIVVLNKAKLDRAAIVAADRLELVVLSATGTDNVDSTAAREHGVAIANIRDYCSTAVAQHVFAMILGLTQQLGPYDGLVRSGAWARSRSFALFDHPIRELAGRALGIVGFGALGRAVAGLGEALGMRVMVSARPGAPAGEAVPGRVPFETLLCEADVISLHCPLTEATHHLIGAPELEAMKRDAILINTARGALVDGAALAHALKTGQIAGAGIDVLPIEPPPPDLPLLAKGIPNLILTPHIAWAARESRQRALDQVAENIEAFLAGRELRRIV